MTVETARAKTLIPLQEPQTLLIDSRKTEVWDIWKHPDIQKSTRLIQQGIPIGFSGFGVYGIGGLSEAFTKPSFLDSEMIPSIGALKERNFYQRPPVAMTTWSMLKKVTNWEEISDSNSTSSAGKERTINLIENLFTTIPVILILPINPQEEELFPFATRCEKKASQAFLCTGVYPPWHELAQEVEQETDDVFFVTSANYTRLPTLTSLRQVASAFPELPAVLFDQRFESIVRKNAQGQGSSAEMTPWHSHNIYDLTGLPDEIRVLRSGNESHALLVNVLKKMSHPPTIRILTASVKNLTQTPQLESLATIQEILSNLEK